MAAGYSMWNWLNYRAYAQDNGGTPPSGSFVCIFNICHNNDGEWHRVIRYITLTTQTGLVRKIHCIVGFGLFNAFVDFTHFTVSKK